MPKPEHWSLEQYRAWVAAGNPEPQPDPAPPRPALDARAVGEADLLAGVLEIAAATGWAAYHTRDSRRSNPGFPDLVLSRPPRLIFAELKARTGRLTPEQEEWLRRLLATPTVEAYVWRPADYPARILYALQATSAHAADLATAEAELRRPEAPA